MELREEPPKHQRTNNGTRSEMNGVDEDQIEVSEGKDDDGRVELNVQQAPGNESKLVQEKANDGESPASVRDDDHGQQEDPRSGLGEEMVRSSQRPTSSSAPAVKPPRTIPHRGRRRQSNKIPFNEPGYQAPGGVSPDLGTDAAATPAKKPRKQAASSREGPKKARQEREEQGKDQGKKVEDFFEYYDEEGNGESAENELSEGSEGSIMTGEMDEHEETIFIEPSQETDTDEPITVTIEQKYLDTMLHWMRFRGWVYEKDWRDEILLGDDETRQTWLKRQRPYLKNKGNRKLFLNLGTLWRLCHEMPKFPDIKQQFEYLHQHGDVFRKSMKTSRLLVEQVSSEIVAQLDGPTDGKDPRQELATLAVKDLCKRIIPMLVLLLKEAFMLGGVEGVGKTMSPSDKCEFTSTTLQFVVRVTRWMKRLYGVMTAFYEAHPPKSISSLQAENNRKSREQRSHLSTPLDQMIKSINRAVEQLDRRVNAPQHRKEAEANDKALRSYREKRERERIEAEDIQMQRFIQSTQREPRRRHEPQFSSSMLRSSAPQSGMIEVSEAGSPAPNHSVLYQGKPDEYFVKNGGWYFWEDDRLLNMIRKVLKPNIAVLQELLPHRTEGQVGDRVAVLKDRVRARYEAAETDPPLWCYHHE